MAHIQIIGAGVIGLSTGIQLLLTGHDVKIFSKAFSPDLTSDKAAAIWFPFLAEPQHLVRSWSKASYLEYQQLARNTKSGVRLMPLRSFEKKASSNLPWWIQALPDPVYQLIPEKNLPEGFEKGYEINIPVIETPRYMPWLLEKFLDLGGQYKKQSIHQLDEFQTQADWTINCTGLGAKELCHDSELYPVRGQLLKVELENPPKYCLSGDLSDTQLAYIVPRSDGIILGGTAEIGIFETEPDLETLQQIRTRCEHLLPDIQSATILDQYAGLRPARKQIRLEIDPEYPNLIHNYGHGGSGYTVSWGCAQTITELISKG